MKNIYIYKACYDIYSNDIFLASISSPNIWNVPENDDDDDDDDDYYLDINDT